MAPPQLRNSRAGSMNNVSAMPTPSPVSQKNLENETIVLVDDEVELTGLMSTLLAQGLGARVVTFNDPVEALHGLDAAAPTFLVSDLLMPRMNGFEFLREVSRRRPELPCVLITGNPLDERRIADNRTPGLITVLFKPVSWREIAALVRDRGPGKS
jgi:DNA-binding NtrC family response regulator